jgi:hypothetical protein
MQHISRVLFSSLWPAIMPADGVHIGIAKLSGILESILESLSMKYLYTKFENIKGGIKAVTWLWSS